MTKQQLESYRSMKEEITELKQKLKDLSQDESLIENDTIMDYRSGYPIPQAVLSIDWKKYDRIKNKYEHRILNLEKECEEIENFVEEISDSMLRRIFRMYFLSGKSQKEIGMAVHLDKSNVSRKIENFLKSQRTQQMQRYNNN